MPKFKVRVARERTEHTTIGVEAQDAADAERLACMLADGNEGLCWELGYDTDTVYCSDPDDIEEVE